MPDPLRRFSLQGTQVVSCLFPQAIACLVRAAKSRNGGSALFCNVHMFIETRRSPQLKRALARATWVWPDGKPLSLTMRLLGLRRSHQVAGPQVTEQLLQLAASQQLKVFLYGGTAEQLAGLQHTIAHRFPRTKIVGAISPPFRPLGQEDLEQEAKDAAVIEASGAHLCFVGLGCPKQELWIDRNRQRTGAVLLGVGAAFPMLAGTTPRAPQWMSALCCEWLYRLCQEPRRLWKRYLYSNPHFVNLALRQLWSR